MSRERLRASNQPITCEYLIPLGVIGYDQSHVQSHTNLAHSPRGVIALHASESLVHIRMKLLNQMGGGGLNVRPHAT